MKPREYQEESHAAIWDALRDTDQNPLVVLPTGAGKSLVIAMMIQQAREYGARVMVLAHRKELLEQNLEKIKLLCPGISSGLYSAGLRRYDTESDVICAGIQSVHRKALVFGRRELVIIDEAHLINDMDDSMYNRFLTDLGKVNPKLRCVGLTATPYRTGEGLLAGPDRLFGLICYEAFTGDLIGQGFLCPLTNQPTEKPVDISGVAIRGGEFVARQMEAAFDQASIVDAACQEIVASCHDRRSVIVFCSGVDHAEHVAETLRGIVTERVEVITGQTDKEKRKQHLEDFRAGSLRWLVNVDVLTTGFDAPRVDCVAVLRATMSPGLFCQIVGRGLRLHPEKSDCLVLDFGGNIQRHGSLDSPDYGRDTGGRSKSQVQEETAPRESQGPAEIDCPQCGIGIPARFAFCPECGADIPDAIRHQATADTASQLVGEEGPVEWVVSDVWYRSHQKKNSPDSPITLCCTYWIHRAGAEGNLEQQEVKEWVCFDHTGFARSKAEKWWERRSLVKCPASVQDALDMIDCGAVRVPASIHTQKEGKWRRVINADFTSPRPTELIENESAEAFWDDDLPF